MQSHNSSEILIRVLNSTSFLLHHYRYSAHDPSLHELQRMLARATAQLQTYSAGPHPLESQ
jgi:hypothetical protein